MKKILIFLLLPFIINAQNMEAPAGNLPAMIGKNGTSVIPNGRFLTPLGKHILTAPHPFGLALSPDGKTAITANSGIKPFSITVIDDILSKNPKIMQIPSGAKNNEGILEACFMGLAINPSNTIIFVAGGEANKVFKYDIKSGKALGSINCKSKNDKYDYYDGYLGDMVMTKNGKTLYVVDQIGFRVVVIDLQTEQIIQNIPTGRYPYGITLSPDEKYLMVANVGVFEYKRFTDLDPKNLKGTAHKFPSSKYGSKEMLNGDIKNGILPLGDPNAPESFSVWIYPSMAESKNEDLKPIFKVKTGFLVGQMIEGFPAVGGSSPNSLVATNDLVFVSNGNNDCVSVVEIKTGKVLKNIPLILDTRLKNLRGIIPFGIAISSNQKRLYVAESGINAIGVIDLSTLETIGHIPTAWFPSKIKISNDGRKLIVSNAKGFGSGPNGGKDFKITGKSSYIGSLMNGVVSVIDIPNDENLKIETAKVLKNNFKFIKQKSDKNPIPSSPKTPSNEIKYIVFISKENRTYDEVFGQNKNGIGDASLARFGNGVSVLNKKGKKVIEKANIMPNHAGLANRFAMSDNFFCDSDVSADGHRWLVATYPNEWCETETAASYGGKHSQKDSSLAPGNLGIYGAAGSIYPEDYNEAGSLWDHLERNKIDFFNFGFGVEMAGAYSDSTMKYIGELYTVNYPLPAPLYDKSSKVFPTYNMAIPDQFRTDLFIKEFNERWSNGNLPSVITLMLPNDHGSTERPKAGFPYQASYMADNDLAVGRTIEFLSKTSYWKNMAVFITEDDPQGGIDHVDAHRSILMVASPYAKKNYVSKVHTSFGSIFKTFWHILGIPYLNQYDAGATDLADMFTDTPDFSPYNAIAADSQIFVPENAMTPINEKFDWKAFAASEELDKTTTMQKRREDDDKILKKLKKKKNK